MLSNNGPDLAAIIQVMVLVLQLCFVGWSWSISFIKLFTTVPLDSRGYQFVLYFSFNCLSHSLIASPLQNFISSFFFLFLIVVKYTFQVV